MATATSVPVEVYLASSFEPDADYVDGAIEKRPVGENDHSALQGAIYEWFQERAKEFGIRVRIEFCVQAKPTRFRVPDVTLLDRSLPQEPYATRPPIAVFEVLSPGDTVRSVMARCADYQEMGIASIFALDPEGPAYRYREGRLEPLEARAFELAGSRARFNLDEIRKRID